MEASFKHQLQKIACKVRLGALEAVYSGKSGHPGGSLSVADILTYLYFKELRVDPQTLSGRRGIVLFFPRGILVRHCMRHWP